MNQLQQERDNYFADDNAEDADIDDAAADENAILANKVTRELTATFYRAKVRVLLQEWRGDIVVQRDLLLVIKTLLLRLRRPSVVVCDDGAALATSDAADKAFASVADKV